MAFPCPFFILSHIVFIIVELVFACCIFPVRYVLAHVRWSAHWRDFHSIQTRKTSRFWPNDINFQ